MASASNVCRLCNTATDPTKTVHVFSNIGIKNQSAKRITALLDVAVEKDDRISPHVCLMCTRRIVSLEKANADHKAFKDLAKSSLQQQSKKRTKETSGETGISPETARLRPSAKLARKKLVFDECKFIKPE